MKNVTMADRNPPFTRIEHHFFVLCAAAILLVTLVLLPACSASVSESSGEPEVSETNAIESSGTSEAESLETDNHERLYYSDFESGAASWRLNDGWGLAEIDGNTVLEGVGHTMAELGMSSNSGYDNYILKVRLKIISGIIHCNVRYGASADSDGLLRYFIGIGNNEISLSKQDGEEFDDLTGAPLELDSGWHDVEIRAYEGIINLYIDDELCLVYNDADYIPTGGVSFETLDDADCLLDNVEVTTASAVDVVTESAS